MRSTASLLDERIADRARTPMLVEETMSNARHPWIWSASHACSWNRVWRWVRRCGLEAGIGVAATLLFCLVPAGSVSADCRATLPEAWEVAPALGFDMFSPVVEANRRNQDRYVVAYELRADDWHCRYIVGRQHYTANHALDRATILNSTPARDAYGYFYWPGISAMSAGADYKWVASWTRVNNLSQSLFDIFGRIFSSDLVAVGADFRINENGNDIQRLGSSTIMPVSNRTVVMWEDFSTNPYSVKQRLLDANGVPLGPSEVVCESNYNDGQPRVSGFWGSADKYAATWTRFVSANHWSIMYAVFDSNGDMISDCMTAVSDLPQQPWIDIGAVGSGFLIAYTQTDLPGVLMRTYSTDGSPYIPWIYIADSESHQPSGVRVGFGTWSIPPSRPLPYFVLSWTDEDPYGMVRGRYVLLRGVASPEFLVLPQWISTTAVATEGNPINSEVFSGFASDLRVGFVWSSMDPGIAGGRFGIKKQVLAFTPGQGAAASFEPLQVDSVTGLDSETEQGLTEFVWVPELAYDSPTEPDVPVPEE